MKLKELVIKIAVRDQELKRDLLKANRHFDTFTNRARAKINNLGRDLRSATLKIGALGLAALYVGKRLSSSFIDAASSMEQYQLRMTAALRSQEKANALMAQMTAFARKVPFEFRDIAEGATTLSAIMKGGVNEIKTWMPLITDLAALTGFTLKETMGQFIRMYSAGANAADLFREKGVLAMLGFQTGARISAEATRKQLMHEWEKTDSVFRGLSDKLATTWRGLMSMFADAWFIMRSKIMQNDIFTSLKNKASEALKALNKWMDSDDFVNFSNNLSDKIVKALEMIWNNKDKLVSVFNAIAKAGEWMSKSVEGWKYAIDLLKQAGGATVKATRPITNPIGRTAVEFGNRAQELGLQVPGLIQKGSETAIGRSLLTPFRMMWRAGGQELALSFIGALPEAQRFPGYGSPLRWSNIAPRGMMGMQGIRNPFGFTGNGNQSLLGFSSGRPFQPWGGLPMNANVRQPYFAPRSMGNQFAASDFFTGQKSGLSMQTGTQRMTEEMMKHWETFTWEMQSSWSDSIDTILQGGKNMDEKLSAMFSNIASSYRRMVSDIVSQRLFDRTFGKGTTGERYVQSGVDAVLGLLKFGEKNG